MMVLASVGLFGSGTVLGGESCGIKGIFVSCHDKSERNAENIQKLADFTEASTEDVFILRNEIREKVFMVMSELAAIKSVPQDLLEVQNCNWQILETL